LEASQLFMLDCRLLIAANVLAKGRGQRAGGTVMAVASHSPSALRPQASQHAGIACARQTKLGGLQQLYRLFVHGHWYPPPHSISGSSSCRTRSCVPAGVSRRRGRAWHVTYQDQAAHHVHAGTQTAEENDLVGGDHPPAVGLLPDAHAVVLLELALIVRDLVLAENPAANRQCCRGRAGAGRAAAERTYPAMVKSGEESVWCCGGNGSEGAVLEAEGEVVE
jgi:hypothetical protein